MSATPTDVYRVPAADAWMELAQLDQRHQRLESEHERMRRRLDASIAAADEADLRIAWDSYRAVVAALNEASEAIERLRLSAG